MWKRSPWYKSLFSDVPLNLFPMYRTSGWSGMTASCQVDPLVTEIYKACFVCLFCPKHTRVFSVLFSVNRSGWKLRPCAFKMCNCYVEPSLTLVWGMQCSKIMELSKSPGESRGRAEHLRLNTNAKACLRSSHTWDSVSERAKKNLLCCSCIQSDVF